MSDERALGVVPFWIKSKGSQPPAEFFSHPPNPGYQRKRAILVPWLRCCDELILPSRSKVSRSYITALERATHPIVIGKRAELAVPLLIIHQRAIRYPTFTIKIKQMHLGRYTTHGWYGIFCISNFNHLFHENAAALGAAQLRSGIRSS